MTANVRRLATVYGTIAAVALATLTFAYFRPGPPPPWLLGASIWRFFALELTTLGVVAGTFFVLSGSMARRGTDVPEVSVDTHDAVVAFWFLIVTTAYAIDRIVQGDPAWIRLPYAVFSAAMLVLWMKNGRMLLHHRVIAIAVTIGTLTRDPESVFHAGRDLRASMTSLSLCTVLLIAPLFTWLPTLLDATISPRIIAFAVASLAVFVFLVSPLIANRIIARALARGFAKFDHSLAQEMLDTFRRSAAHLPKAEADRMRAFLELRDSVSRSINVSATDVVGIVAQHLAVLAALISITFATRR